MSTVRRGNNTHTRFRYLNTVYNHGSSLSLWHSYFVVQIVIITVINVKKTAVYTNVNGDM